MGTGDVCREFSHVNSTIQKIWTNGTKIFGVFEHNGSRIKRFRTSQRNDVDKALLKWSKQQKN